MQNETATIYFDESGFTGENLLNPNQSYFVYGSVKCTESEAKETVERILAKHKLQGDELKGRQLVKSNKGKRAIKEILEQYDGRTLAVFMDKKFALACKFFEYIFEPIIAQQSSLFYNIGFHLFISNILYLDFMQKSETAETIFKEFEEYMRKGEFKKLTQLLQIVENERTFPPLKHILEFAAMHREMIISEIEELPEWTLDLTMTSLMTLLTAWGERHPSLRAICDNSKPLLATHELFESMVGREETVYTEINGITTPMSFNLHESIILADSKEQYGIQIADVVAAAVSYSLDEKNNDEFADYIRSIYPSLLSDNNIFPDFEHVDLENMKTQLNALVLTEIHGRSREEIPLLDDMHIYIQQSYQFLSESSF